MTAYLAPWGKATSASDHHDIVGGIKISGVLGLLAVLGMVGGCAMQSQQQSQSSISPVEEDSCDVVVYFLPLDDFNTDVSASLAQLFLKSLGYV